MLGLSGAALSVTKSVITLIVATVTIIFLTFFMLLEGRGWVERVYGALPGAVAAALVRKIGDDIYKTVGGYVTGNILISLIAGASATDRAADHGRAVRRRARAARRDPRPDPARRRDGRRDHRRRSSRSCTRSRRGSWSLVFVIVYQQLENHFLQPVIYGRTVQLSPLAVLVSVLVGAELAGILGALAAIPVAGSIQVLDPRPAGAPAPRTQARSQLGPGG